MKLITASELANKTLSQLIALYRMISDELAEQSLAVSNERT